MFGASKSGQSIGKPDPQFNYVTALLHGDGTNGAQNNTFLDSSSNNFTVTRSGSTTQGSWSAYGSLWSNYFNGSTDFINAPSSTALGFGTSNFTMEMWVFSGANGTGTRLGGNGTGGGWAANKWIITTSTPGNVDKFVLGTNNSSSDLLASTSTFNNNQWMHVAITRSGNSWAMFVNGTRESTVTSSISLDGGGSNTLYLGKSNVSGDGLWAGYVSNFRIVIGTAVYNPASTTITVPTTPLTAITNTQLLTCQSNRFIDNSTNNLTISTGGTPSVQRFNPFLPTYSQAYSTSVYGGSAYFNGSTDYLTLASNTAFNIFGGNMTVECWFNASSISASAHLFAFVETSTNRESIYFNSSQLTFYSANALGSGNNIATSALSPNTWYHMALVKNGATFTLYLNGVSVGTSTTTYYSTANQSLQIGTYNNAGYGPDCFNGYMCDIRVVKGTAVYTSNFTPPTAPLTAISGTSYLGSMTNGAIYDNAIMNDLTTVGSAQISTSVVKYGTGSIKFNGSTDYLVSNSATTDLYAFGSGDFTIEMWVRFSAITSGVYTLYDSRPSGGQGAYASIALDQGTAKIYYYVSSGIRITGTTTIATATWYHVAISRSGTSTKLFINGTQEGSTYTDSTVYLNPSNRPIIGGSGSFGEFVNGYIDDLRITKGYARYTSNFTPPTAALPNYGSST
jgi:hypothetical protein